MTNRLTQTPSKKTANKSQRISALNFDKWPVFGGVWGGSWLEEPDEAAGDAAGEEA